MVHVCEDVSAIHRQQPATGGDVNRLWGLLAVHWKEAGPIHKVSTLSQEVCQSVRTFYSSISEYSLLYLSGFVEYHL